MIVEVAWYTGRGRIREENEDSLLVGRAVYNREESERVKSNRMNAYGNFFVVADGMGGYAGGATASGIIVSELAGANEDIKSCLKGAREKMHDTGREDTNLARMGSVVTGIYIERSGVTVFNVGDSRTYLMQEKLSLITEDDSLVWELYKDEVMTPEERHERLRKHPQKNIVTSALMAGDSIFNYQEKKRPVKAGDKYLVCSDGLWEELTYSFIEDSMKLDVEEAGKRLKDEALAEGRDNISFIVVEIKSN